MIGGMGIPLGGIVASSHARTRARREDLVLPRIFRERGSSALRAEVEEALRRGSGLRRREWLLCAPISPQRVAEDRVTAYFAGLDARELSRGRDAVRFAAVLFSWGDVARETVFRDGHPAGR